MMPRVLYYFLFLELIYISYLDIKYKKISNLWSIINIFLFIIISIVFREKFGISLRTFWVPLVFLFVGFVLFTLKIMGAGDVKFLFSFFLMIPQQYHEEGLLYLAYSTIIIGFFMIFKKVILNFSLLKYGLMMRDAKIIRSSLGGKLPYSPVILVSWIIMGIMNLDSMS